MFTMVSCLDYNCLWACTCTHACTAHKIVHAPFPPTLINSKIRHFRKMAVTSSKCVETAWLSQSGKFFGWFWGGLFSSLFSFGAVFLQKIGFFDFQNFKNCWLIIFRGPGGALLKNKIFLFCFGHEPMTIWGIYRPLPVLSVEYSLFYSRFKLWGRDFAPPRGE